MSRRKGNPHGDGEMSFEDIGRELGITKGGAWMLYQSAIRKLRRQRHAADLAKLQELARLRQQLRPRPPIEEA